MAQYYVKNSTNRLKKALLCPPTYLEYHAINAVGANTQPNNEMVNKEECTREHELIVQAYRENGVEVVMMEAAQGLPYQVYVRDVGACIQEGYIAGSFREPIRKGELSVFEEKMKELKIPCAARCTAGAFEGGDFWFLDEYILAVGVVARTDRDGVENVRLQLHELGYEMIAVPCLRQNLHLDMCFNMVEEKVAIVCKEALPYNFLKMLEKRSFTLINISQEDVFKHYANVQALGDGRILSCANNRNVNQQLKSMGLKVIEVEVNRLLKRGGGIHCMTFPIERA